jgi:DNA-3-methyladenine glycosylase II
MVLQTPFEMLRAIGLSKAKVNYVQNVAQFCLDNKITNNYFLKHSNEEIIDKLTQIKGVGKWTVEMLLMFSLGRENVFSVDDLGIQQAMCKLYNIRTENKKNMKLKMQEIAESWQPYQTYACLHLWAWKDDKTA